MFPSVNDIAGQTAQAERQPAAEIEERSDQDKHPTQDEKPAAKFAERIHSPKSKLAAGQRKSGTCWRA